MPLLKISFVFIAVLAIRPVGRYFIRGEMKSIKKKLYRRKRSSAVAEKLEHPRRSFI